MLKQLRIQNFKCWKDTGAIRMARITLFFGVNSSGKSSIGQFLMMLKQTVESPDRKTVFYPGGKSSAVRLGSYQEMVFHRDPINKIIFDYQWSLPETLKFRDSVNRQEFSGDSLVFHAEVGLGDKEDKNQHTLMVHRLNYDLLQMDEIKLSICMERQSDNTKCKYKVDATNFMLKRNPGRVWYPGAPVRFYGFPDEVVAYYQNADFVQNLNLLHEKLFSTLCYLGPLRTKAERLYIWSGTNPESVGYDGENTIAAILAARNRKISLGYKRPAKPFEEIIALKLREMGLIEELKVNPISEQRQEYEVKIRTRGSSDWVDLPDVGFGISQVLPVIVQCFYAPAGSIIIVEQPEIHLHPSAQSALADVMIDAINAREDGKDRNIQLIIETHSEHFLRRIQRRIAEDVVSQGKVSAYFANITKTPATLDPLQIDIFGNIQNWPENFFGDEMGDITEQAKASIKKRMQKDEKPEASE
uniref:DUF3696 domain-containing protein n=1 Tax=Desulfatirhabdium butyrativorans TaxID=340467 RepID=A0A7C4RT59_9BACT